MGSIHHLTRYLPKLAKEASALKPLFKKMDKPSASRETQAAVKVVDLVSPTDNPIKEALTINEKNVDVAKGSSTPVITDQADTIDKHLEQGDEQDMNGEPIICTKNGKTQRINHPKKYRSAQMEVEGPKSS